MSIEIANVQGIGNRSEQQDAFGASRIGDYDTNGILLTVCDGMGGMASGGVIARDVLAKILEVFPWKDDFDVPGYLSSISKSVYDNFFGQGGSTVVMIHLKENRLRFWSIGDSDILLFRNGRRNHRKGIRDRIRFITLDRIGDGGIQIFISLCAEMEFISARRQFETESLLLNRHIFKKVFFAVLIRRSDICMIDHFPIRQIGSKTVQMAVFWRNIDKLDIEQDNQ